MLGVMSDGKWNTWRDGAITYCDVGDMVMQYVAYRYLATRGGTLTWHIGTWPVDTWPSIGGTYHEKLRILTAA